MMFEWLTAPTEWLGSGGGGGCGDQTWLLVVLMMLQMPWPLGVLLTPRHMERYNALFQLLLRLKRVQLALESAWQELGR
jgi:3-deoxy-D-manno-octulosonic-acid transferase